MSIRLFQAKTRRGWILAGLVVVSLPAVYLLGTQLGINPPTQLEEGGPETACWVEGRTHTYQLSYNLRTSQNQNQANSGLYDAIARDQTIVINGVLSLHAMTSDRVTVSLLPQLYRALGHELVDPAQYFQQAIELRYNEHCRVQTLVFDGRMSFKSREILRSIINSLDYDRRAMAASDWSQTEDDIFGAVEVRYSYQSNHKELLKSRLRVVTPSTLGDFRDAHVNIEKSETRFHGLQATPAHAWPQRLESRETLRIKNRLKNADILQEKVVRLEARDSAPIASVQRIDASRRVEKKPHEAFRGQDRSTIYNAGELRRTPAPATLEETLDAFEAAMHAEDDTKAKKILGAHLLAHPESFSALEEKLIEGEFDTTFAAHIFFLMTRLTSPEAERLLTRIAGNESVDSYLRMQAIISLGDVREPSETARKVLMTLAAQGPGERDTADHADMKQRLHSTSVLAYGAMASQAADVDPEFEDEAKQNFKQLLGDSAQPEVLATVLTGIGNFRHPDFYEVLEDHLSADHPAVRMGAATAFAKMDRPEAEGVLIQRLGQESSVDVRAAIAKGLLNRNSLEGNSIQPLSQVLKQESAPKARHLLIDVLGRAVPAHPEVVDVLVEQAERESDALALQRIGQYVPAEKMLIAVKRRGT